MVSLDVPCLVTIFIAVEFTGISAVFCFMTISLSCFQSLWCSSSQCLLIQTLFKPPARLPKSSWFGRDSCGNRGKLCQGCHRRVSRVPREHWLPLATRCRCLEISLLIRRAQSGVSQDDLTVKFGKSKMRGHDEFGLS